MTGLTYVMTVARAAPTSAISRKNKTNATAVHTTASRTRDRMADRDGQCFGTRVTAQGA